MKITINGTACDVQPDTTVLAACRQQGIEVPTLCYHDALGPRGACRLCVVEVEQMGRRSLATSCNLAPQEGMIISTDSDTVLKTRRVLFELLLGRAGANTEAVRRMAARYGVTSSRFETGTNETCVRCGRCIGACTAKLGVSALCFAYRGDRRTVTAEFGELSELCIGCGACASVCPTGAIVMQDDGDVRIIRTQDRVIARHALEHCTSCGKPFASKKFIEYVATRIADMPATKRSAMTCPECSRFTSAAGILNV